MTASSFCSSIRMACSPSMAISVMAREIDRCGHGRLEPDSPIPVDLCQLE
jgi:hypothetical protein